MGRAVLVLVLASTPQAGASTWDAIVGTTLKNATKLFAIFDWIDQSTRAQSRTSFAMKVLGSHVESKLVVKTIDNDLTFSTTDESIFGDVTVTTNFPAKISLAIDLAQLDLLEMEYD